MAKKIKYTQKELKGPDKFSSTVIAGFEYFSDHSRKIVLFVVIIIAVLVAAYIANGYRENKGGEAVTVFNDAVVKYKAGNNEEALSEFLSLKTKYPDQKITDIAIYYAGIINFKLGKYDECINDLNEFLDAGVDEDTLNQSAVLTQGLARFKQGQWQQAIEFLSKFPRGQGSPYLERAQIHMAMAYEKLGQPQKAEAIYKDLYKTDTGLNRGMSSANLNPQPQSQKSKTN